MLTSPQGQLPICLADKSEKKAILRFYKAQHYSARFIGLDSCYVIKKDQHIIASVIISKIQPSNKQNLLHALVVAQAYRGQGLASHLLQYITQQSANLVCFAKAELAPLYSKHGFTALAANQANSVLSSELFKRYQKYQTKQPTLTIFTRANKAAFINYT